MGFDLFVQCVRDKGSPSYDRRIAEEIFNRDAIDPSTPLGEVRYADGRGKIYGAEDDQMDGVMIAHFCGRTIVERAFELAEKTGALILWPDTGITMAVTSRDVINQLPADLKAQQVALVHNVDELIDLIGLV